MVCAKYGMRPLNISSEKSKYWKFFSRVVEKYDIEDYEDFIEAQFATKKEVYPQQLISQESWQNYIDYKNKKESTNKRVAIVESIITTIKKVRKWSKDNGYDYFNFSKYFQYLKEKDSLDTELPSPYICAVSKSFDINFINVDKYKIQKKAYFIYINKQIKNKLMEVMGDDFIEYRIGNFGKDY
jgi:hypothetical protein